MKRLSGKAPFIAQMTPRECIVACLAMVLAWHEQPVSIDTIRRALSLGPSGASAFDALRAAAALGLAGRGLRVPIGKLDTIGPGAILHWEAKHFVVLESVEKEGIWIADPAFGRRFVVWGDVRSSFGGLALAFEPAASPSASPSAGFAPDTRPGAVRRIVDTASVVAFFAPLSVSALAARLGGALLMGWVIAASADARALEQVGLALLAFAGFQLVSSLLRERLVRRTTNRVQQSLATAMADALLVAPAGFAASRSGDVLARRFEVMAPACSALVESRLAIASEGAFVVVGLLLLAFASPWVALAVACFAVLQIAIMRWLGHREERATSAAAHARTRLQAFESKLSSRLADGATDAAESDELRTTWASLRGRAAAPDTSRSMAARETLGVIAPIAFMWLGVLESRGLQISYAVIIGVNCLAVTVMRAALSLFRAVETLPEALRALERAEDVLAAASAPDSSRRADDSAALEPHGDGVACSMRTAH